ncbi:hypothetical protein FDW83_13910 [Pseudarthrobacter sp. NamE2]|nr:hypothetical protein FDW83_13910 [Pseudarthrobacter sp. NamE2]
MYLLVGFLFPATAAMAAVQWGITSYARVASRIPGARMFPAVLTTALQGLVLAVLILLTLLVQAFAAGLPATVAAVSAGIAAAEGVLFGSMGAGVAALGRGAVRRRIFGWLLALFLILGTVVAGSLLVPAVRSEEPVSVALNVQRSEDGTPTAYECSGIPAGTMEVYRTERIMWLPAVSPGVVFVMLAGQPGTGPELLGWLSSAFQEAADGTQVPCVNGEPRSPDAVRMPVAAVGLLLQAVLAGALLAGAHAAAARRRDRSGT